MRRLTLCALALIAFALIALAGCASNDKPRTAPPAREQSMIVDDPQVYRDIFQALQRAVFVRQGLSETNAPNTRDPS